MKWEAVGAYELKGIARPTAASFGSSAVTNTVFTSNPTGDSAWDSIYSNHFGASVGYLNYHNWGAHLYVVSYNSNHSGTAITFFGSDDTQLLYRKNLTSKNYQEHGAFFNLLVGQVNPVEAFGFLNRDPYGNLKIKYGMMKGDINTGATSQLRIDYQSTPDTSIDTGTDVGARFTTLYRTTNKLSFAALTDTLFVAQVATLYTASFALNQSSAMQKLAITETVGVVTFTRITSISVLKVADNEFYLAVGDPADNSNTGKVVVFDGMDSVFSDIKQTFEVKGGDTGDWFGWSVKLQLLDRDGAGSDPAEPVLFVGAPKASSDKGYVQVFAFNHQTPLLQTITPPAFSTSYVGAFGYSVERRCHNNEQLPVGGGACEYI